MFYGSTTIGKILRATAEAVPDKPAIVQDDLTLSYRQLDDRVDRLVAYLAGAGIGKGDRVAYIFWSQWEILLAYHAVTRMGAVVVSLNFRLTAAEIAYQIDQSGTVAVLYDHSFSDAVGEALATLDRNLLRVVAGDERKAAAATVDEAIEGPAAGLAEDHTAVAHTDDSGIWFTSGTTGRSKGAVVRHSSAIWAAVGTSHAISMRRDSRVLSVAPLFHRGAMEDVHLAATLMGATHVLMPRFEPRRMLEMIEQHRITHAFVVPTMSWMVLNEDGCGDYDLSSMECWMSAAAPFSTELQEGLRSRLRIRPDIIVNVYGITESLLNATCTPAELIAKPTTVGRPVPGMLVRIHDDDDGFLAPGEIGEIVTCGPTQFRTYLNDEAAFRDATFEAEGRLWYRSGDLGYRDRDGHFHIVDRKKDMIISGGENVYSVEVEVAIGRNEKVAEVAVIGKADEKWGEIVVAVVVAKAGHQPSETEIVESCHDLAPFKRPREIRFVDALPRNSFGKVQKTALRDIGG